MSSAGGETQQKAAKVVPKSNREHGVAGSIAAAVAVLVLHPMDVLKVRLQGTPTTTTSVYRLNSTTIFCSAAQDVSPVAGRVRYSGAIDGEQAVIESFGALV